jgi:hypothetical protein
MLAHIHKRFGQNLLDDFDIPGSFISSPTLIPGVSGNVVVSDF